MSTRNLKGENPNTCIDNNSWQMSTLQILLTYNFNAMDISTVPYL